MNIKKSVLAQVFDILKEDIIQNTGNNRYLLLAVLANIPTPLIFIPYVTQAVTMILLGIHIFHYPKNETTLGKGTRFSSQRILGIPVVLFILLLATFLLQLFWFPFMTQLISIVLLISAFVLSKKYI